ncbi:MAG: class I SAM-dependent methyltransferase, partial [Oscillospiraceae bacterium]|nr:class I SAM-dependent methyltransferase [Oscillospiraceae bacterium]
EEMMNKNKYKEMERIIIDKKNIDELEEDIIIRRGLERYMYARQFVYGDVLDIACGVGYGSYLMSKNPDVKSITGYDRSEKAIDQAKNNFCTEKTMFVIGEPTSIEGEFDYQEMAVTEVNRVLVSVLVYGQDKESVRNVVTEILDAYN